MLDAPVSRYDLVSILGGVRRVLLGGRFELSSPLDLPNPILWLRADTPQFSGYSDNQDVTAWTDESPSALNFELGSAAKYRTNRQNGQPGIQWPTGVEYLTESTANWMSSAGTIYLVGKAPTPGTFLTLFSSWDMAADNNFGQIYISAAGKLSVQIDIAGTLSSLEQSTGAGDNVPWIRGLTGDGTTCAWRHNGAADGSGACDWFSEVAGRDNLTIGGQVRPGATDPFYIGDFYEIVAYSRVLSDLEIVLLEQYLNSKWAVY